MLGKTKNRPSPALSKVEGLGARAVFLLRLHAERNNEADSDGSSAVVGIPVVVRMITIDVQVAVAGILVEDEIPELAVDVHIPSWSLPIECSLGCMVFGA